MSSRSDELRFYETEKRILRQFEDDRDVQDYLEYLENQDEELFIRVSDLKIEIQELEQELEDVTWERDELESEVRELELEISELEQELEAWTEQED